MTGDGLAAALLLCAALEGRRLSRGGRGDAAVPAGEGERPRSTRKELTPAIVEEVERIERELGGDGRVLVRPSGTEPLIRVLAEAENAEVARRGLC